ncbi:MAG TPA: CAP domain-containing protein, partial [Candidatus Woesebacteria bacterium]|nr:CAP domain-containing protein [Candidatus Woesebacteria bacterium]
AANILIAQFNLPHGIANALGFFIMAFVGEVLLFALSVILFRFVHPKILDAPINKRLSFIPALASALILTAFFLTAVLVLPVRPNIKQSVTKSRIGNFLTSQTMGLERSINNVFGGAIQEALAFMTVKPQSDETVNLNFTTTDYKEDLESERTMLQLLNSERQKEGLPVLKANESLRKVARAHCSDMFTRGYFSHYTPDGLSPFDRMDKAQIEYRAAGENLAYAPNVEIAHQGLMDSPGHRANILSDKYGQVGIGVMDAGIYGKMFCQVFSN